MAYIGRGIDNISNASILDVITFTGSVGPYNLEQGSSAFTPISAQALVISIDGVIQSPSSYTISAATITFDTSMASTSTNDFIVHNGVGLITEPSDGSVTTAKIEDLAVTAGKLAATQDLSTKTITLPASVSGLGTGITNAQLAGSIDVTTKITGVVPTANLGSGTASASTYLAGNQTYQTITEYDDNQVQSNIAMLGFKVAVNGSLTRYNLVDQSIDEFYDTSGVDASASVNDRRVASGSNFYYDGAVSVTPTVTSDADSTTVDGDYTYYKWTTVTTTGDYTTNTTQDHIWLVVAGGGAGCGGGNLADAGGGGGGGGYRYGTTLSLIGGNTYTVKVGDGGTPASDATVGGSGGDSEISGTGITTITSNGGGGGKRTSGAAGDGGSGGGGGYNGTSGAGNTPAITQYTAAGETTTVQGYAGGTTGAFNQGPGGGGASEVGETGSVSGAPGAGGDGLANSITGSSETYAGGGGGGRFYAGTVAAGGAGGGGAGGDRGAAGIAGLANTGGGGGARGGYNSGAQTGVAGGSGIVVLRRLTSAETPGADLTLQSTDVTALSAPTYGEFVTLIENAYGTATLNTDIKGYVSRDSGTTFTQGTLVDEGTWGTNKKVLGFHDLDISSQPSGVAMCYKITTHNQVASSKETRIYATSIGWR